jgi:hypothetical protein
MLINKITGVKMKKLLFTLILSCSLFFLFADNLENTTVNNYFSHISSTGFNSVAINVTNQNLNFSKSALTNPKDFSFSKLTHSRLQKPTLPLTP